MFFRLLFRKKARKERTYTRSLTETQSIAKERRQQGVALSIHLYFIYQAIIIHHPHALSSPRPACVFIALFFLCAHGLRVCVHVCFRFYFYCALKKNNFYAMLQVYSPSVTRLRLNRIRSDVFLFFLHFFLLTNTVFLLISTGRNIICGYCIK